jgi:hypothetical protein
MKKKRVFLVILTTILCCSFAVTSAWAGAKQRYRWEGVAIGIGAAILGSALLNTCYYPESPQPVYYKPRPVYCGPAPVYYRPAPVYYRPAVVCYTPAPARDGGNWKPYHRSLSGRCDPPRRSRFGDR